MPFRRLHIETPTRRHALLAAAGAALAIQMAFAQDDPGQSRALGVKPSAPPASTPAPSPAPTPALATPALAPQPTPAAAAAQAASLLGQTKVYKALHALCIGINNYQSDGIPDLAYAENDASDMAKTLRETYGFDNVDLLVGSQATKEGIVAALANFQDPARVGKEDGVVIYFSGHGQTVPTNSGEQGYLLPYDAQVELNNLSNPAPFRRFAIRMDDLRADADAIPARHVLFLIDACYSGYLATKSLDRPEVANALKYPARQVITAGTKGEQAIEHNSWGHGAFTYKLLQHLDIEQEPIFASGLGSYLKTAVPREVAAKATGYSLTPQAKYLSGEGDFVFVRPNYGAEPEPTPTPAPTPAPTPTPAVAPAATAPPSANQPPVVAGVAFQSEEQGSDKIEFDIVATDPDGDPIVAYYYRLDGQTSDNVRAEPKVTMTGLRAGSRTLTAWVMDARGAKSEPFAREFTVKAPAVAKPTPKPASASSSSSGSSGSSGSGSRSAADSARNSALSACPAGVDPGKNANYQRGMSLYNSGNYSAAADYFQRARNDWRSRGSSGGFSIN